MTDESLSARSRALYGAVGVAVLAGATGLAVLGTTQSHAGATYYDAVFGRAGQGLDLKSDVKIRGITVGGISGVKLQPDGRVRVRLRVDKGYKVPTTATAQIEAVSVFGPKDMILDLGSGEGKGPYLRDGGTIARTEDPQELADVAWPTYRLTSAINPQDIATTLHTFAQGLQGQGPALRRTIDNGAKLLNLTYGNRAEIRQLLTDVTLLAGTLENRGGTIVGITRDLNDLSPALNGRPDNVARLLDQLGEVSDKVGDTLDRHGDQIGKLIDGSGKIIQVVYRQDRNIPVLIDGLNGFFEGIGSVIRVPGPEGSLLAQTPAFLPLDICKVIVDVCPASPKTPTFNLKIKGARG